MKVSGLLSELRSQSGLGRSRFARRPGRAQPTSKNSTLRQASITAERIVGNSKGNDYRLVLAVDFQQGIVLIKWLRTHADYDRIDVAKVNYDS